jgi:hypothetical protein
MSQKTITINGTVYDAHTGLPIEKKAEAVSSSESVEPVHHERNHPAHTMHQKTQKSHILNRQVVKKDAPVLPQAHPVVKRSPHITKFAPHPSGTPKVTPRSMDIGPVAHPMVQKAHDQMARPEAAKTAPKPSQAIKQEAIAEALQKAPSHKANTGEHKIRRKFSRMASLASASLALLLLAGYFAYINMPHLSIRVAAAQAGINASYPEYKPDGYSLSGPIAYGQGEVDMKFASNSGPQNFSIKQTKTDWDSSAVQENYVKDKWGNDYMPYSEHGLTIYAHDGNAVWVNGGILYTIEGDAPLSASQIRSIATSL